MCVIRSRLVTHYNIQHFHQKRMSKFPCVYTHCLQSFSKLNNDNNNNDNMILNDKNNDNNESAASDGEDFRISSSTNSRQPMPHSDVDATVAIPVYRK